MPLKIGIVGLPNVGKSTLFQAITKKQVDIANYPFTTIDPNVGVVAVPDDRLIKLIKLIKPERSVPATIEFIDVAGLVKGAHQGEGLGNQFLAHLQGVDAILFLLRAFKSKDIVSVVDSPEEQLKILQNELLKKDEEIEQRQKEIKKLETKKLLRQWLSEKPSLIIYNIKANGENYDAHICDLALDAKLELEIEEMSPEEIKELSLKSSLPELIKTAYQKLNLITFYTIKGGKEVHAWATKRGTKAPGAGGQVHSDFEEKFIRSEVIQWDKLIECGSWSRARELGWLKTEGKDYEVRDGDVIEFKI